MDKLTQLYPPLANKAGQIINDMQAYLNKHLPGYRVIITEGFRTTKYQQQLYAKGRTTPPIGKKYIVTNCDGVKNKSHHQSSLAFDIGFLDKQGKLTYNVANEVWAYFGHLARQYSLDWGGDWKSIVDRPHAEWPPEDHQTYNAAKEWQKNNGLV